MRSRELIRLLRELQERGVRMFLASGMLGLTAIVAANWATAGQDYAPPRRHPRAWGLLRRYPPGRVLVMGIAMGFGLGLPTTFLRPFAAELQIPRIALFFAVYSGTETTQAPAGSRERAGRSRPRGRQTPASARLPPT